MRKKGFTLIELLVVVAVIGILAAILLPALSRAQAEASAKRCQNNLKQIFSALRLYLGDSDGYLPRRWTAGVGAGRVTWKERLNNYLVGLDDRANRRWLSKSWPGRASFVRPDWVYKASQFGGRSNADWIYGRFWIGQVDSTQVSYYQFWYTCDRVPRQWTRQWPAPGTAPTGVEHPIGEIGETTTSVVPYPGFSKVWLDPVPGKGEGQYMVNTHVIKMGRAYPHIDEFKVPSQVPLLTEAYGIGGTGTLSLFWPSHEGGATVDSPPAQEPIDWRHIGPSANVLFLDGHVERVSKSDLLPLAKKWATIARSW